MCLLAEFYKNYHTLSEVKVFWITIFFFARLQKRFILVHFLLLRDMFRAREGGGEGNACGRTSNFVVLEYCSRNDVKK